MPRKAREVRIYRPTVTRKRGGRRIKEKSQTWRARFKDPETGKRVDMTLGTTDQQVAESKAQEALKEAKLRAQGVFNPYRKHELRPLAELIDAFREHQLSYGTLRRHAIWNARTLERVAVAVRWKCWRDATRDSAERYLRLLRAAGRAANTVNHTLSALKCFANWLVDQGYARENPFGRMKRQNTKVDRRYVRRALTVEEQERLLMATQAGPGMYGRSSQERANLYRLALETGLRRNEIRNLVWADFSADDHTLVIKAEHSKRRREDVIPLRPQMAALLDRWRVSTGAVGTDHMFGRKLTKNPAEPLRADLDRVGIPVETELGVIDFHSLRHTFASNLARSGVHPKVAQDLLRHSDINLTMNVYAHTLIAERASALERLPDYRSHAFTDRLATVSGENHAW